MIDIFAFSGFSVGVFGLGRTGISVAEALKTGLEKQGFGLDNLGEYSIVSEIGLKKLQDMLDGDSSDTYY